MHAWLEVGRLVREGFLPERTLHGNSRLSSSHQQTYQRHWAGEEADGALHFPILKRFTRLEGAGSHPENRTWGLSEKLRKHLRSRSRRRRKRSGRGGRPGLPGNPTLRNATAPWALPPGDGAHKLCPHTPGTVPSLPQPLPGAPFRSSRRLIF